MGLNINLPGPFSYSFRSSRPRQPTYGVCGIGHRSRYNASRCRGCAQIYAQRAQDIEDTVAAVGKLRAGITTTGREKGLLFQAALWLVIVVSSLVFILVVVLKPEPAVGSTEWCKGMGFSRYMDHPVEAQKCPGWEK